MTVAFLQVENYLKKMLYYHFCRVDNEHIRYFEKSVLEYHIFLKWGTCGEWKVGEGRLCTSCGHSGCLGCRGERAVHGPPASHGRARCREHSVMRAVSQCTTDCPARGNLSSDYFTCKLPGLQVQSLSSAAVLGDPPCDVEASASRSLKLREVSGC